MGQAVNMTQAIKIFTLLMTVSCGVWISGHVIGDTADEILGWFGKYNTQREGYDTQTLVPDAPGSSI